MFLTVCSPCPRMGRGACRGSGHAPPAGDIAVDDIAIGAPLPRELRAFLDVGPGGVRGKEAEGLLGPATFAINNDAAVAASLARVAMLDLRVNEC
jgi:hypothetical protein